MYWRKVLVVSFGAAILTGQAFLTSTADADGHVNRYSFAGFYAGAHIGGAWSDADFTNNVFVPNGGEPLSIVGAETSPEGNGVFGGGHAGYNWQSGNIVGGFELSFSGANLSGGELSSASTTPGGEDDDYSFEINSVFQAVARLGYASGKLLAYGKIGFASADVDGRVVDTSDENVGSLAGSSADTSERHSGLVLGGGIEYALSDSLVIGVDYSYINFQDKTHKGDFFSVGPGIVTGTAVVDIDPDVHAVVGRISYKFGGARHSAPLK